MSKRKKTMKSKRPAKRSASSGGKPKNKPTAGTKKRRNKHQQFGDDFRPEVRRRDTLSGRLVRRELTARTAAEAIGDVQPGCEIFGLTMGKFSLIDLMEHLLKFTGPADCLISTWTAGGADMAEAHRLRENGSLKSFRLVIDYSFPFRQPAYCAAIRERFGDDSVRLTQNHSKFVVLTNDVWNLVVRTSMNLNECRRVEWFEISDSADMAAWIVEVCDELFERQKDTFERTAFEHIQRFGEEWDDRDNGGEIDDARYFSDDPTGVDLRRAGSASRS